MSRLLPPRLERYRESLEREYAERFPRSLEFHGRYEAFLLDGTSHAVRWNDPFVPIVKRAHGATIEDLDGNRLLDYWQGHFANLLGHNATLIRDALGEALAEGRGLQSGMVHELEGEVAELICRETGAESVRLTTSGTLGTLYAAMLARAYSGRRAVLKVAGGWHGGQPYALRGVSPRGASFEHLESEGLQGSAEQEILLTRLNDIDDLHRVFREHGDQIACFLIEPILGAGGGMQAEAEYLREVRRLTAEHGALMVSDEIITGFRFRPGDLTHLYGIRPDLWVLGKVIGGGMPVAAVAGRRDVLELCSRDEGRVKFEGGTYSAHELSLVASRTLLRHLLAEGHRIYPRLAELGRRLREGLEQLAREQQVPMHVLGHTNDLLPGSSLVYVHFLKPGQASPTCPEKLAARAHPLIDERLLRSTLMLEGVSVRYGAGAVSTAHGEDDIAKTLEAYDAAIERLRVAGLL